MIALPRVGLGAAPLGGLFEAVDAETARATVDAAVGHGWAYVDTAPLYGHGLSERRVGDALRAGGHDVVLSTKVGRLVRSVDRRESGDLFLGAPPGTSEFDFTDAGIRRSLHASLERLKRECIDIALVHDPERHIDNALRHAVPALQALRAEGVVGAIGVGTNEVATATRFVLEADVDVVLVAGRCTLLDRTAARELLPLCAERGVAFVAAGVFNSGILADPEHGRFDYGAVPHRVRSRVDRVDDACRRHGVPLAAAAIQYPLRHRAVSSIVVGCRSPGEVAKNAALLGAPISDDLWSELDDTAAEER